MDLSRLSINQRTTNPWTLRECIEGYAREGVRAIGVWRDKLTECGVSEAKRLLDDHGTTVSGHFRGGFFPAPNEHVFQEHLDDNRRAIDEAAAIGAQCLVLVVGGLAEGSRDLEEARKMVRDGIAAVLPYARDAGVPLAIEPLHPMYAADRSCVNTVAHANDMCDELGEGAGIALDVYHVWWEPNLRREIERAGRSKRILSFHVSDWNVPTTDILLDRGMMGDGAIDFRRIRGWVDEAGYDGFIEVEIFSGETWWKKDPAEVVRICKDRFEKYV